jgi:hypothetical protein
MEGTYLLFSLLWEARYKVSRTLSTHCQIPWLSPVPGYIGLVLRGNSLPAQSQPPGPTGKPESFWELEISAEYVSLTPLGQILL